MLALQSKHFAPYFEEDCVKQKRMGSGLDLFLPAIPGNSGDSLLISTLATETELSKPPPELVPEIAWTHICADTLDSKKQAPPHQA